MDHLDQILISTPTYLAEGIGSVLLTEAFLLQKRSCRHLRLLWTCVFYAMSITLFALYDNTAPYASVLWVFVRVVPVVVLQECFFARDVKKQVFLILSFLSGVYLLRFVDTVVYIILMDLMADVMNALAAHVMTNTQAGAWKLVYDVGALAVALLTSVIYAVLLLLYLRLLKKSFIQKEAPLSTRQFLLLILPSVSAVCVSFLIRTMILAGVGEQSIFFVKPVTRILLPAGSLLLLALIVATIALLQGELASMEEQKERALLQLQMHEMQREVARVQESQADLRGLRHDLKNHIEVLRGMMQGAGENCTENEGTAETDEKAGTLPNIIAERAGERTTGTTDSEKIGRYLQRIEETVHASEFRYDTGEIITDIILTARAQEMAARGIRLDADFRFPVGTGIDPYDIGIILNNALENAMEACHAGDLVTLHAYLRGALFFIEVENPLHESERLTADAADEAADRPTLPPSTKSPDDLHGLGLRNILRCAKRYHGTLDIGQEDGLFCLTVMLAATHTKNTTTRA